MKSKRNRRAKALALLILLPLLVIKTGCRKADIEAVPENENSEQKATPGTTISTNLRAQQVVDEFKRKYTNADFAKGFASKYGAPLWEKSMLVSKSRKMNTRDASAAQDSVMIIPVIKPNSKEVVTYLEATLAEPIKFKVYTANKYSQLGFGNATASGEAERLAVRFMILNKDVFGYTSFKITDKRLFNGAGDLKDTASVQRKVIVGTSRPNAMMYYQETCVDVYTTTTINHCPYAFCTGPGGSCDNCTESGCATIIYSSTTICEGWWVDDGGGGGGGSTGDTGGGGGGGYDDGSGGGDDDPCSGSGDIIAVRLPCDDGGGDDGGGWEPVPIDEPDSYTSFYNNLTHIQKSYWDNSANAKFVYILRGLLENNNYSSQKQAFVKWGIDYLIGDSDITPFEFQNYFVWEPEGSDGVYDATYWENPSILFQQAPLPTFQAFIGAFPKKTNPDGSISYLSSNQVYDLVGGNMNTQNDAGNPDYQNACAIRGSRALNYSNNPIDNTASGTELGSDGKRYILNAKAFNAYMNKKYGAPTHRLDLSQVTGDPAKAIKNFLRGKDGIYSMVTKGGSISGHVDLIIGGTCLGGAATGNGTNVKFIEIWKLP